MTTNTLTKHLQSLIDLAEQATLPELLVRAKERDQPSEIVMNELLFRGEK